MAEPASVATHLARNIVALRKSRGLTQEALAKLAAVPRSTINHLESGAGNPSLLNLSRLAAALRVTIEELLATPRADCKLVRSEDLPSARRAHGSVTVYKLLPDPIPGMEMDRMELEPGARMGGVPHLSGTKEYLTCFQGEVTVHVAGRSFRVGKGDVLAFPGDQPHSYQNSGSGRALCLSVVSLAPAGT